MENKSTTDQLTTLVSCLAKAKENGFTEDFMIKAAGLCTHGNKCYRPGEVHVENFYRFEGVEDNKKNKPIKP